MSNDASSKTTITYFGYGSLVNRTTRPAGEISAPARLNGWQRVWSHRNARAGELDGCSSLNVRELDTAGVDLESARLPGRGIDGVIATIDLADLPALDARESGYDRRMVPVEQFDLSEPVTTSAIAVYVSKRQNTFPADTCFPVLQSYIDCVMAGFLDRFGDEGLLHFLATTEGWHSPVDPDRDRPRYVRALDLPTAQLAYFDSLLLEQRKAG